MNIPATVSAVDPVHPGHPHRVAHLVRLLAARAGLGTADVEAMRLAALLHDVGKLALPRSIFLRSGPLTQREAHMMRQHPVLGAQMLSRIPALAGSSPSIRHHHERFDGRGYPSGLRGCAIPFGARLIAIADTFDAMTSPRCYRDTVNPEQALAEIDRCAGTQFDPELAAIFCEIDVPTLAQPMHPFPSVPAAARAVG